MDLFLHVKIPIFSYNIMLPFFFFLIANTSVANMKCGQIHKNTMFTWQFFLNYITFECLVKMVENSLLFILSAYFSYTELPFANVIVVFHVSDCFNHLLLPIYSKILSILPSQPLIAILCLSQAGICYTEKMSQMNSSYASGKYTS